MKDSTKGVWKNVFRVLELLTLAVALHGLVPPIMSDGGPVPTDGMMRAVPIFLLSRLLSWASRDRHFLMPAAEFLIFWAFSILLAIRFEVG